MTEEFKKSGKCIPYKIDDSVREGIKSFTNGLILLLENEEVDPRYKQAIKVILNDLEPYDKNLLLAYYEYGESPSVLGKLIGVSPAVISVKIKKIKEDVHNIIVSANNPADDSVRNGSDGS